MARVIPLARARGLLCGVTAGVFVQPTAAPAPPAGPVSQSIPSSKHGRGHPARGIRSPLLRPIRATRLQRARCPLPLRSKSIPSSKRGRGHPARGIRSPLLRPIRATRLQRARCPLPPWAARPRRQRSLQYLTCSQHRAHFRRHSKGRPQATQSFVGLGPRPPRSGLVGAAGCRRRGITVYHAALVTAGRSAAAPRPLPGDQQPP
jgi:hypothetical protein